MGFLRRHRVGVGLLGLAVLLGLLVTHRLKDQQARAVPRARADVLVGVVTPERRNLDVKLGFTADLLPAKQAAVFSQIEAHRAALQLAQTNLGNTRLLSPFVGYISQRNLDPGTAVSVQSAGTNTASVGILTIQDISSVKVQIEVPERDIARVAVGSPVRLTVDPYQGESFGGSVTRVVHALDPRSRTMGVACS